MTARSLFSAVHGMVLLGLEQKLIAVPVDELRKEIATIVGAMVDGLTGKTASPVEDQPFSRALRKISDRQNRRPRGLARGEIGMRLRRVLQRIGLMHLDLDRA